MIEKGKYNKFLLILFKDVMAEQNELKSFNF